MLDIIAEFLIDAIGDLFESGAETAPKPPPTRPPTSAWMPPWTAASTCSTRAPRSPQPVDAAAERRWRAGRVRQPPGLRDAPVGGIFGQV